MKLWGRVAIVMLAGLLSSGSLGARSGGGGHGGHGGHGGFTSGRSSGPSSGKGVGHAIGHSFGHLFGRRSKPPKSTDGMDPPLTGAAGLHRDAAQLPQPSVIVSPPRPIVPHRPINDFPFGDRFLFFPHRSTFAFGGCQSFAFPRYPLWSGNDFNCFAGGFFFDPFLIGGLSGSFLGGPVFLSSNDQRFDYVPDDLTGKSPAEIGPAQPSDSGEPGEGGVATQDPTTNNSALVDKMKSEPPATLLQLRDGSMYGLVDYWVEDGQLHYTTTYGGQNSVELDRIDPEKTVQLNAERGIQFVLRAKTTGR